MFSYISTFYNIKKEAYLFPQTYFYGKKCLKKENLFPSFFSDILYIITYSHPII